jgi:hypothetical protein
MNRLLHPLHLLLHLLYLPLLILALLGKRILEQANQRLPLPYILDVVLVLPAASHISCPGQLLEPRSTLQKLLT